MRGLVAAGASEVLIPHSSVPKWHAKEGQVGLEQVLQQLRRVRLPKYAAPLFSAHQMGTARMGSSPRCVLGVCICWVVGKAA